MPRNAVATVTVTDLPEVEAALAQGAASIRELAALKKAISRRRDEASGVVEGIDGGTIQADDEGYARARAEADVWDEVAALIAGNGGRAVRTAT